MQCLVLFHALDMLLFLTDCGPEAKVNAATVTNQQDSQAQRPSKNGIILTQATTRPSAALQLNDELSLGFRSRVGYRSIAGDLLLGLWQLPEGIFAHLRAPSLRRLLAFRNRLRRVHCGLLVRSLVGPSVVNGRGGFVLLL